MVVGGSGSGKTRYYVKPNLMQLNSELLRDRPQGDASSARLGHLFAEAGYEIRSFDTIDFARLQPLQPASHT